MARTRRALILLVGIAAGAGACSRKEIVAGFPDSFAGVGLELRIEGDNPVVVRPLEGGPAEQAGVQIGDRILFIDGRETNGMTLGSVVMMLRGQAGSQVTLTMERAQQRVLLVVRRQAMQKTADKRYRPAQEL